MRPADLNTPWAELLLDRLAGSGVRQAVISPGSRSTPLVLAAAAEPRITLHTIVDERSAAFFALGQAKVTGRPTLLICTSGSAAANYLPAIVEASLSSVPLIVLTADRPPELHHRAAPQTIDQVKLFGGHVRRYFELGAPDEDRHALEGLGGTAALAVSTSLAPSAGPVHVNAWFRKPLEPPTDLGDADAPYRAAVRAERARPVTRRFPPSRAPQPPAIGELTGQCLAAPEGLIVCGPGPLSNAALFPVIERLARATGYPLLAEAPSQFRFVGARGDETPCVDLFDPLLRAPRFLASHAPKMILQVGSPPTSKGFELFLDAHRDVQRWVLTGHGWNDPYNQAAGVIAAGLASTLGGLAEFVATRGGGTGDRTWTADWVRAGRAAERAAERLVDLHPNCEAAFVRALAGALPQGSLLFLGNSLPVREIDLFCPGTTRGLSVLAQRGANGIDGLVSGAAGAASVAARPVTLLLGDVSFAHDLGGLVAASACEAPLNIVVLDNGGGRMFDLLPIAQRAGLEDTFERHFLTPRPLDRASLAAAHGLGFHRAAEPAELAALLEAHAAEPGARLIEVAVADGGATRALHDQWHRLVDAALDEDGLLA